MEQSSAVWLVILASFITANIPFAVQRPLLPLPWQQPGEPSRPATLRLLESIAFFAVMVGVAAAYYQIISNSLVFSDSFGSFSLFYGKVLSFWLVIAALMTFCIWRSRGHEIKKTFLARLIEVFVFYMLCGTMAFAFELNLGNRFPQTWEFYAITASLYVVLGYPGFVLRYLLKRRRAPKPRAARQQSANLAETS